MQKNNTIFFLFCFFCMNINIIAQDKLLIYPQYPERNKEITITYNPKGKNASIPDSVSSIDLVFTYSNLYEMPSIIPMRKVGEKWVVSFLIPRYFLFASFYLRSGTTIDQPDSNHHFVFYPYINKKPVPRAILNYGYSLKTQFGKRPDLADSQAVYYKREILLHPDSSYEARLALSMYYYNKEVNISKKDSIINSARKIIADNFYKNPGFGGNINQTTMGYLMIGDKSRVDSIRAVVREHYPKTQAGYEYTIDSITRLPDTIQIISSLEKILLDENQFNENFFQSAHLSLFNIYANEKNSSKALRHLNKIRNDNSPYYAINLKNWATTLYSNGILLNTAFKMASEAFRLSNTFPTGIIRYFPETSYIPSYATEAKKKETEIQAKAITKALMSAIKMKQGDKTTSLLYADQSRKEGWSLEAANLLFSIYYKYHQFKKAYEIKRKAIIEAPEKADEMMPDARLAYLKLNPGNTKGWLSEENNIMATIKQNLKLKLNKELISTQLPITYNLFQSLDGKNLTTDFGKNKVIIMNFWATWCVPCMKEMPYIHKVWQKYKNEKDVQFMIINSGSQNTIEDARSWYGNDKYGFPVYFNNDRTLGDKLKFNIIPVTFIIDKSGIIRFKFLGFEGPIIQQKIDVAIDLIRE
ncbi:MAG TPA: redoxin family protein [Niabella sp.]|nr:redoxin family protein [Niabella sp.]